ncbi:MAG: tetratricopeptide repeat protein [Pyrinomonadaceae bacterium]
MIKFLFLFSLLVATAAISQTACSAPASDETTNSAAQVEVTNSAADVSTLSPQDALAKGTKLLESGQTEKAIDVLLKAVESDPKLADAYFQLGVAYALIEKRDAAKVAGDVEATPTPKDKKTKEVKSNSEMAFEKAVSGYKKIISADDEDGAAYFNLGRAYNKLNEDEDAAKALKQAVKINSDDTEYQTELGAILIKLAQYHEAIDPLKKALEIDPSNTRAEELLGDAEAGRKRIDYASPKKDEKDKKDVRSANTNANLSPSDSSSNKAKPITQRSPKPAFPMNRPN